MQSIMQPQTLVNIHFTLLAYAPELVCLSHCTFMSKSTNNVVYIYIPHYCTHKS